MNSEYYAPYKALLKQLVQAAIAIRPKEWLEGVLLLEQQEDRLICRLMQPSTGEKVPVNTTILQTAQSLSWALIENNVHWESCQIGFYRKSSGWGIRVRFEPAPEDWDTGLMPFSAQTMVAELAPAFPAPARSSPALTPAPAAASASPTLEPSWNTRSAFATLGNQLKDGDSAELAKLSDTHVSCALFSVRLLSKESLIYETEHGRVPMFMDFDEARNVFVVHAARVSTMDAPFGSRMLTPQEHQAIVNNLRSALRLLPNRFEIA